MQGYSFIHSISTFIFIIVAAIALLNAWAVTSTTRGHCFSTEIEIGTWKRDSNQSNWGLIVTVIVELFLNDFCWIHWIQWIVTKQGSEMVTRNTLCLVVVTFSNEVVEMKFYYYVCWGHYASGLAVMLLAQIARHQGLIPIEVWFVFVFVIFTYWTNWWPMWPLNSKSKGTCFVPGGIIPLTKCHLFDPLLHRACIY